MPDALELAQKRVEERARGKSKDWFFLANDVLGFQFQPDVHAELFASLPPLDPSKPWVKQSVVKDYLIMFQRGFYKSSALVVWMVKAILLFPDIRILIMQGSIGVTKLLLKQVYSHFDGSAYGSRFKELYPEYCGTKKELHGSAYSFVTCARKQVQLGQATVTVASPKSVKTGQHYDIGIFDDLQNESNWRNTVALNRVLEDFTACQPLIDPGCPRIVSGTRWAYGDLYEQIMRWQTKSGKWLITIRDCWSDESRNLPEAQKKPRFPQRKVILHDGTEKYVGITLEELRSKEEADPAFFACQYLLKPQHANLVSYTHEMFWKNCLPRDDAPWLSIPVFMVDLASSGANDDSVIQCLQQDAVGCAYLTDMRGGQWQPVTTANNVIDMALLHRPAVIFFEKSAAATFFVEMLKQLAATRRVFLPIEFVKIDQVKGAKAMRIQSFAGVVAKGRIKYFLGVPQFEKLVQQAVEFQPNIERNDDYIDCLALGWKQLTGVYGVIQQHPPVKDFILAACKQILDKEQQDAMALRNQIIHAQTEAEYDGAETGL